MTSSPAESFEALDMPMQPPRALLHRTEPFVRSLLRGHNLNADELTTASVEAGSELYGLVCAHVAKQTDASFTLEIANDQDDEGDGGRSRRVAAVKLGLGLFPFKHAGADMFALHSTVGEPQGTDCGVGLMHELVLLTPGKGNVARIKGLCDELLAAADKTDVNFFTVYRWNVEHGHWRRDARVPARPLQSVVLPEATRAKVVDDVMDFVSEETAGWYREHGIPYKRAYLLWGAPGSGKTSLVQALAGRLRRNVCYLSPTHPKMTDDNLKNAVQRCPANSILVLEDVDALFGAKREKKVDQSPLTFSGLLNAIDGVGSATGQIFILTTNHREQLDPALIRNGRVDLHVGFGAATAEQMRQLFAQFYPEANPEAADGLAARFEARLVAALGAQEVSMAALQHYFILMRKRPAEEAADGVQAILEEMAERKMKEGAAAKQAEAKEEATKKMADGVEEGGAGCGQAAPEPAKAEMKPAAAEAVHVHVHLGK